MNLFLDILFFLYGSLIGSFLNVVILRLPEEQKLTGRSHCPKCNHVLGALDLIPLLSWLFLLGKCRYCKTKISPRYFIIEFIMGALFLFSWLYLSPVTLLGYLLLIKYLIVISILLAVFVIDLEHFIILDSIIFPGMAVISILNLTLDVFGKMPVLSLNGNFVGGVLAALACCLPFFTIWYFSKGKWMGFGDVKLALFLGVSLGWPFIFVGLMLGVLIGGLVSIILLLATSKTMKSQIPFGTFLSFGTLIAMFYGYRILEWYLSILGF